MGRTETFIAVQQVVVRTGAGQAGPSGLTEDCPAHILDSSSTGCGALGRTPVTPLAVLVTVRHLVSVSNTDSVVLGFLEDLSGVKVVAATTPLTAGTLQPVYC